jgi:UDP-N-acetylglucosamine 2-epimerase
MDIVLANTIQGLSRYINENKPDLIVIHGDRIEALAGAIVGSFNNILVAHIEGGEKSGTIDDSIRHSINSDNAKRISLSPRTITTTNDDTVQKWGPLGTSVHYYTTKN